jgi:hypothetical protein
VTLQVTRLPFAIKMKLGIIFIFYATHIVTVFPKSLLETIALTPERYTHLKSIPLDLSAASLYEFISSARYFKNTIINRTSCALEAQSRTESREAFLCIHHSHVHMSTSRH